MAILSVQNSNLGDEDLPQTPATFLVYVLAVMAAIGGFLFGYDTGVISGAMIVIREDFALNDWEQEIVVSSTVLTAVFGCLAGGPANQIWGRRPLIIFSCILFIFGAAALAWAPDFKWLVLGRLVVGFAVGLSSQTVPMYVAEVAPPHMRGVLVGLFNLLTCLGQFIAGMIDGLFATVPEGWRWMLGLSAVPAIIQLVGFLFLPESPRWLTSKGKIEHVKYVLRRLRTNKLMPEVEKASVVQVEVNQLIKAHEKDEEEAKALRSAGGALAQLGYIWQSKPMRRALVLGCFLMFLQQFAAINTVMYYAASIYSMAGYDNETSIWLSGYTALAQAVGVFFGILLVDRMGRRPLLLLSVGLVTLCLGLLGLSFLQSAVYSPRVDRLPQSECSSMHYPLWGHVPTTNCARCVSVPGCGFCGSPEGLGYCMPVGENGVPTGECAAFQSEEGYGVDFNAWTTGTCATEGSGTLSVVAMVLYLVCFGIGISPIPWTMTSEIYPQRGRALMTSASTGTNWICNFIVSMTFLSLASPMALGPHGAFFLFAIIGLNGWLWLFFNLPETKGLSLEEVEVLFTKDHEFTKLKQYQAIV